MSIKQIPNALENLTVPIDGLQPYERNPRQGNIKLIADSLEINGQYRPIVVRTKTNEVLAGNHTLAAAQVLGWTHIAATYVDVGGMPPLHLLGARPCGLKYRQRYLTPRGSVYLSDDNG